MMDQARTPGPTAAPSEVLVLAPAPTGARVAGPDRTWDHTWELRDVEFEDALGVRRFECVACGAVRFE